MKEVLFLIILKKVINNINNRSIWNGLRVKNKGKLPNLSSKKKLKKLKRQIPMKGTLLMK